MVERLMDVAPLKIGYFRRGPAGRCSYETALRSLGCHTVRADNGGAVQPRLRDVLAFIGEGDQLVVPSLEHLGESLAGVLELIERLDRRGASLMVVEPTLVSTGPEGDSLRAALQASASLEGGSARRPAGSVAEEVRRLHHAGIPQARIARQLQISRMTVWRKLREG